MSSKDNLEGLLQDPSAIGETTSTSGASNAPTADTGSAPVSSSTTSASTNDEFVVSTTTTSEAVTAQPVQAQTVETHATPTVEDDDTIRVQRYEEELRAQKVQREAGAVRVSKDVVEEQRTLEVPVTREEVVVRSVDVSQSAGDTTDAFQSGTIEVPLSEQDVTLRKQTRVAEEIEIEKRAVQERQQVSGTVRKERVEIEEVGNVETDVISDKPLEEIVRPRD